MPCSTRRPGSVRSPRLPAGRLAPKARDATAILPSLLAIPAFIVPSDTGTTRREAAVHSVFLMALNEGFEAANWMDEKTSVFRRAPHVFLHACSTMLIAQSPCWM